MTNDLVQHITMEESTSIQWVNESIQIDINNGKVWPSEFLSFNQIV